MLEPSPHPTTKDSRERLVSLLDYVEQVVRLDERVAFSVAEYKLPDGKSAWIGPDDTRALPGVRHDTQDDHGPIWLEVDRLARQEPPAPPDRLTAWMVLSSDPGKPPVVLGERHILVDEAGRLARTEAGACPEDFAAIEAGEPHAPAEYRLTLRLADHHSIASEIDHWIARIWAPWSNNEKPRRRTITLYEQLYKLLQQLEQGGADAPIEVVWGIGIARWTHAGRTLYRPLIERGVDLDLDEAAGGLIRVRPTVADATVDLKPYEDLGCPGLPALDDTVRREIDRAAADEGVSPFRRDSFEPILVAAAARLHPDGVYLADPQAGPVRAEVLCFENSWLLFARPRTSHVVLADIEKLKNVAREPERVLEGVAARLVTEPSSSMAGPWEPLSAIIGEPMHPASDEPVSLATEVFFPKPFNDDQIEIVRRLARSDGLVVQGPPGTGKTHTIANLICHAMATGQRVLVVSRGEAALSVLRDQLPEKVRPLAIAILANERQGLRQVEGAVREIQSIVEASRPDVRRRAIAMAEAEIVKLRLRISAIDSELDGMAGEQAARMGPRQETPAELARRIAGEREIHAWFTDRPTAYAAETGLTDTDFVALATARGRIGDHLDHAGSRLPSPADLPHPEEVVGWHEMILKAEEVARTAVAGPARGLRLGKRDAPLAEALADALDGMARLQELLPPRSWFRSFLPIRTGSSPDPWAALFETLCREWLGGEADRAAAATQAVELPPALLDDADARAAIDRAANGDRLWPLFSIGKAAAKALLGAVRLRGAPIKENDATAWRHVEQRIAALERTRDLEARWRSLASEVEGPDVEPGSLAGAATAWWHLSTARESFERCPGLPATVPVFDRIAADPEQARALASQLRQAAEAHRLDAARAAALRIEALFETGQDRTSGMARLFFADVLGQRGIDPARIAPAWMALLRRLEQLHDLAPDFATVAQVTARIGDAGAPRWAERLRVEPEGHEDAPPLPADWRTVWDFAAAEAHLARIDARARLLSLANQRAEAERNVSRLFVDLVRERTFYELERRLSPAVKSALVQFVSALSRLGKGTGRGAGRQRRAARDAMRRCYDAVPCWIMPTWRVAEQLPADLAAFDLVILDEASQSDVTELPAVLRGRKILVVGDDRQVSPIPPFVSQARIDQMRQRHLRGLPFQSLLEPGESLYTLMQAVFPEERLMLKEHFRCVEPIIRFSMQFYPETLLPLRIPSAAERLDPPLVDIFVPHGARDKGRKINRAEAAVIVDEIAALTAQPGMEARSIGVISLIGGEQAELVHTLMSERIGAELMQRHRILCGDSATFQGNERDIVFLSMVADRSRRTTLTMRRYEQRFNVAVSRARDRVVLVRSVERADLNPQDLKAKLLVHFEDPMPQIMRTTEEDPLNACESQFERDVMGRLLALGYHVEPQVGALGFRIDMVVEGEGGRRLAVECDGDAFHGPEAWREDMRRQRVLERVGWRFWRCFASSFYLDPDGTMADLTTTLTRFGIEPLPTGEQTPRPSPLVERRIAPAPQPEAGSVDPAQAELDLRSGHRTGSEPARSAGQGDRVLLTLADGRKPLALVLTDGTEDLAHGLVSLTSPLGQALLGREAEEEIDLPLETGTSKALIERIERADA